MVRVRPARILPFTLISPRRWQPKLPRRVQGQEGTRGMICGSSEPRVTADLDSSITCIFCRETLPNPNPQSDRPRRVSQVIGPALWVGSIPLSRSWFGGSDQLNPNPERRRYQCVTHEPYGSQAGTSIGSRLRKMVQRSGPEGEGYGVPQGGESAEDKECVCPSSRPSGGRVRCKAVSIEASLLLRLAAHRKSVLIDVPLNVA
jgi:hypothetical protein